ncbi:MAG: hypothetical protein JEZ09_03765 [Salinivirgaceae bacterium]|nr:hypothetical protein [Salinivirgaceae bacterium]
MKILKIYILAVVNMLIVNNLLISQETTICLLDGKKVLVNDYKIDNPADEEGVLFYNNAKGKQKKQYLDNVFSIVENGTENIIYKQNIEMGDILTPEQMKMYVKGLSDALENYKVPDWVVAGGFASGYLGGVLPQPTLELEGSEMGLPLGILIPVAYIGAVGAGNADANALNNSFPESVQNEYYLMGVESGVQKKRIKKSLIGGILGFTMGVLTYAVIN